MKKSLLVAVAISVSGLVTLAADNEKKPDAPRRGNLLEKYDKNKNGKLDQDERETLRKDRAAERTKQFDKNGDGKIDEKEREAARSEFRKRREESAPAKKAPAKEEQKKDVPAPAPAPAK
jgi:Ca2+-binding EF-hand superfamily protein